MPSQKQLKWSELRVGITVVVASVTLAVLVFLISGTSGIFTHKITLIAYFDNAEGLRGGQPVDFQGVAIGNVTAVHIVPGRPKAPVQVRMKINSKYAEFIHLGVKNKKGEIENASVATIQTAGVLGESFIDIDSSRIDPAKPTGPVAQDGAELPPGNAPGYQDVIKSSQTTLQRVDILVGQASDILKQVQEGSGTLAQVINDPTTINKVNGVLNQIQGLLNDVNNGRGTIGQLFTDKTLITHANDAIDKLGKIVDEINSGKGNLGKLLKDETLYNNLHQTIATANKLMDDLNAGRGPAGKLLKDEELAGKLKETVNKLSSIAGKLDAGQGSAGLFLQNPSFYNNTDQLLVEMRNLVKSIRENPKKYLTIHFRVF
ncbi:MAG TPA: MlaD family protein [Candidatus Angelobacter sp.]|nr:MlaD family protein [Candidatus Angelobacter sp.]